MRHECSDRREPLFLCEGTPLKTSLRVFLIHGMLLVEIIDRGVNHMRMRHKPWADDFLV